MGCPDLPSFANTPFLRGSGQAQSQSEEEDDANRTAKTPEECVRPDPPDDDILSDVSRNLEANQAYEDCLKRTEGDGGSANGDDAQNNEPDAIETSEPDPAAVNRNATQPEECVEPETPDEGSDPDKYAAEQQAYDDCLLRTGPDGESEGANNGSDGDSGNTPAEAEEAPSARGPNRTRLRDEMRDYGDCLQASGGMENDDTVPGDSTTGDDGGEGGLNGMVMGFFKNIMTGIWDWTFGWALDSMSEAFKTNLLSLPNLEDQGDLLSVYKGAVEKLRPAILVGILVLGILMMVRSDNYDLAYAGFQGLPRLMGIALALAFLPQFMGELSG